MAVKNPLDEDNLAGNASDSRNKFQDAYNNRFSKIRDAEQSADTSSAATKASGGSLDSATPEERRAALAESEEAGQEEQSSLYNSSRSSSGQQGGISGLLMRLGGAKNKGATTGAGAGILFIGGIMIAMAGGSSFWNALEKNLTNESSNDGRTNLVMRRAFNNMIGTPACGKVQLICKMKTATKEQVKKWKDGLISTKGQIVDEKGNPTRGSPNDIIDPDKMQDGERVKITSLVFNDTYEAKNVSQLNDHADKNVGARSMVARVVDPLRSDFLHGRFSQLLQKFGINKGRATAEEKKVNEVDKGLVEEEKNKASSSVDPEKNVLKSAAKASQGIAGSVTTAAQVACMAYNITRISVGAVKAVWVTDLIRFGWPFFRLISKIADGSATDEDFQEIDSRFSQLTDYLSLSKASELEDKINANTLTEEDKTTLRTYGIPTDTLSDPTNIPEKRNAIAQIEQIKNKNAFDSQGLRMMLYGDKTGLSEFTQKFTTGAIGGSAVIANSIIQWTQQALGFGNSKEGKQNIRTLCIAANTLANGIAAANLAQCFAPTGVNQLKCLGDFIVGAGVGVATFVAAQKALELVIPALIGLGVNQVALDLNLKGPAAGNAVAAAMGLFLTRKSQSSALKPATELAAISAFVSSTNDVYNKYGTEIAQYDARSEPFNTNNRYSFMGQIMDSLNPYPADPTNQTGFSFLANVFGIVSHTVLPTAQALHSQPALLTLDQATLASRTNNGVCRDLEKQENDMICDWSGQTIDVSSPRVVQWANEDATGKSDHLSEVVQWMQKPQATAEGSGSTSGTKDESCDAISQFTQALGELSVGNCTDSGDVASIDEQGKTVPKSQFEQYIKYCTGQRDLEMGSTDIDTSTGSAKEQDWHSGKQCTKDSYMMDAFAYYYNMCYVQYAVANNATDCTNDTPPGFAAATSAVAGSGSIADTARLMGAWGGQYNSCYTYGGGHGRDKAWIQESISNHFAGDYAVDCSAFVRAVILQATGNDIGDQTTQTLCADTKNFEHVDRAQAQPGDLAIDCANHVEVITDVNGGNFKTVGSHTTGCGDGFGSSPGTYQGTESFVLRYKGG